LKFMIKTLIIFILIFLSSADMAFMARISDPLVGASYMTLLNTLSNLGGRWVKTFFLWLVDIITWKSCIIEEFSNLNSTTISQIHDNKCVDKIAKEACTALGGKCVIDIDGYYIEVAMNAIYGVCWYFWGRKMIEYLQKLPISDWHTLSKTSVDKSDTSTPLNQQKD
jgi:MFS transporter, PAT family, solute carrier family 33 (acetyl-CoA transportor), member 1